MAENADQILTTLKNARLFLRGVESQLDLLERQVKDPHAMADRIEREKQTIYSSMTDTLERLSKLEDYTRKG